MATSLCGFAVLRGRPGRGDGSGLLSQLLHAARHAGAVIQGASGDAFKVNLKWVVCADAFLVACALVASALGVEAHVCAIHDLLWLRLPVSLCTPNRRVQGNESSCLSRGEVLCRSWEGPLEQGGVSWFWLAIYVPLAWLYWRPV